MDEKSIEVLEAELEALRKENLERELAAEKKKAEDAAREAEALKAEEYKEQIRKEVMEEMAQKSNIVSDGEPEQMVSNDSKFQVFLNKWTKNHGLQGLSYEETLKNIANRGGY